jgi:hypothetical protein
MADARPRERAATAEYANAQARNRGLTQFLVRSMDKVETIALWHALTHNMVLHVASDTSANDGLSLPKSRQCSPRRKLQFNRPGIRSLQLRRCWILP